MVSAFFVRVSMLSRQFEADSVEAIVYLVGVIGNQMRDSCMRPGVPEVRQTGAGALLRLIYVW
jgi:hypothetical protein